jgi:hypothetical protein
MEYPEAKNDSLLSDAVAIRVLVEKVRTPNLSVKQLAKQLQNEGVAVTSKQIQDFFLHHGILKKTATSASL